MNSVEDDSRLRIKGILRKEKERSDEVLDQVRKLFEEAEIKI